MQPNPTAVGTAERSRGGHALVVLALGAGFVVSILAPGSAEAITRRWTGAVNALWGTDGNWSPAGRPANGDDLIFDAGGMNRAMSNDIANLTLKTLSFTDGGYSIAELGFTLSAGLTSAFGANMDPNRIEPNLVLSGAQSWGVRTGRLVSMSCVRLNGALTFDVAADATVEVGTPSLVDCISGTGGIVKKGAGTLELLATNSYADETIIEAGFVVLAGTLGMQDGTAANGTTVRNGGSLVLSGNVGEEALVLNGPGQSNTGCLQGRFSGHFVAGPVTLASNVGLGLGSVTSSISFGGAISGPGRLGLGGPGLYTLDNGKNSFAGGILWGAIGTPEVHLLVQVDDAIPASTQLDIPARGQLQLSRASITVTGLAGAGKVALGGGTLTIDQAARTTFSGPVDGPGLLRKKGAGELTLTGQGIGVQVEVGGGVLGVSGGTLGPAAVMSGGRLALSNNGTVGTFTVERDGQLAGKGAATGNSGALLLKPDSRFLATVFRRGPAGFSSVNVTGTVILTDALLSMEISNFFPNDGTIFTIIANDGTDAVIGTFRGLPEGTTLIVGGRAAKVSYKGGTGNDVTLTMVARMP